MSIVVTISTLWIFWTIAYCFLSKKEMIKAEMIPTNKEPRNLPKKRPVDSVKVRARLWS